MLTGLGRMVVLVRDQDEALTFYRDVLGFMVLRDEDEDGYRSLHVGVPGQEGVGVWLMPASGSDRGLIGNQAGHEPLLVLYTDDLDALGERLRANGVEVWAEREDPDSRSLHFRDLYGNVLIAVQLTTRSKVPASGPSGASTLEGVFFGPQPGPGDSEGGDALGG